MKQYLDLCKKLLAQTKHKDNRTGIPHVGYFGDMMKFDLADGFPAVTTKQLYWKQTFAEMLGFLRGYTSAADFRKLGCKVWDANANENEAWLNNPHRKGEDDLGQIYGAMARNWPSFHKGECYESGEQLIREVHFDQLRKVYYDLRQGIDDRREIITHWNPSELHKMALPPCHLLYKFGLEPLDLSERYNVLLSTVADETIRHQAETAMFMQDVSQLRSILDTAAIPVNKLHLSMYQRSCDVPLGIPFNIAGYAWLLSVMAHITNTAPGIFTHFMDDIHYYINQEPGLVEQILRDPMPLPKLWINPDIKTLEDLETWVTVDDFKLEGYVHHPAINFPFAV